MATAPTALRDDIAAALASDDAILTGEQIKELVRFEAAGLGLTYSEATRAAARGTLPEDADEIRSHIALLGLKVR